MSSGWLIVEATFPSFKRREVIRRVVKPVVDKFQRQLETFHFFFEPHLLLRIKADERCLADGVKPYVEQILSSMNALSPSVHIDPHYTEEPDYGDGWDVATKIFELGSKSAILRAEADANNIRLGPQFNEGKLLHLVLNQWGYSVYQEATLHFRITVERLAMHFSRGNLDLLERKYPDIIKELQNGFWQEIVKVVSTKIAEP